MAGQLGTAFGVGTAARLVSIDEISDGTTAIRFRDTGLTTRLYEQLKQVQEGTSHALREWRVTVPTPQRSEERRVGTGGVRTWRSGWSPWSEQKKNKK